MKSKHQHQSWTSRFAYILVATGATVGLGNLWRFPYAAGENGGGVFILIYLLAVFFMVSPLFMAETLIGRLGRQSAPNTFRSLAEKFGQNPNWKMAGFLGLVISIMVLSFFSVITAFSFGYVFKILTGSFVTSSPEAIATDFGNFTGNPWGLTAWHTVVAILTAGIVGFGIRDGIERSGKILMPILFLLLVGLAGFAFVIGDFGTAFRYLFTFEFSDFNTEVALAAFGQAFFSMSVGSCGMLTYAAYVDKPIKIGRTTATIALGDTFVALMAAFAIFPLVFGFGLNPGEGAGLVFVTLPVAFGQMAGGTFVALGFYLLFIFAAVTTLVGLLETVTSYFVEKEKWSRKKIAFGLAAVFWALGLLSVFSFNILSDFYPLGFVDQLKGVNFLSFINGLVGSFLLPIMGILISIFAAWIVPPAKAIDELGLGAGLLFRLWRTIVGVLAPVVILYVLLSNLF